jgi:hypothetical protein
MLQVDGSSTAVLGLRRRKSDAGRNEPNSGPRTCGSATAVKGRRRAAAMAARRVSEGRRRM